MEDEISNEEQANNPVDRVLVPASVDDLTEVKALLQQASYFKQSRGDDVWGSKPYTDEEVQAMIERGNMYLYRVDGVVAASIILAPDDVRMWGETDGADGSALYVHRFCVGDAFRGQGLGDEVLALSEQKALAEGKTSLRLDCPYENEGLCSYYEQHGFKLLRRWDKPPDQGARDPSKGVYKVAYYQKDLV
jgi:ribosomal protein S18 acetylase RimI-like enzyme